MKPSKFKLVVNAIRGYYFETTLYRRLPRHNKIPGGCSAGKLYPLPSNPTEYAVCIKCGRHVYKDVLKHYGVDVPQDVPKLKGLAV